MLVAKSPPSVPLCGGVTGCSAGPRTVANSWGCSSRASIIARAGHLVDQEMLPLAFLAAEPSACEMAHDVPVCGQQSPARPFAPVTSCDTKRLTRRASLAAPHCARQEDLVWNSMCGGRTPSVVVRCPPSPPQAHTDLQISVVRPLGAGRRLSFDQAAHLGKGRLRSVRRGSRDPLQKMMGHQLPEGRGRTAGAPSLSALDQTPKRRGPYRPHSTVRLQTEALASWLSVGIRLSGARAPREMLRSRSRATHS